VHREQQVRVEEPVFKALLARQGLRDQEARREQPGYKEL
jgi:hypothetical protein